MTDPLSAGDPAYDVIPAFLDDDDDYRETIRVVADRRNLPLTTFATSSELLEYSRDHPMAPVIADYALQGDSRTGVQTLVEARDRAPHAAMFLFSGFTQSLSADERDLMHRIGAKVFTKGLPGRNALLEQVRIAVETIAPDSSSTQLDLLSRRLQQAESRLQLVEQVNVLLVADLLEELRATPNQANIMIAGPKRMSVEELALEIEEPSEIGLQFIEAWVKVKKKYLRGGSST